MVDVTGKATTLRRAVARCQVDVGTDATAAMARGRPSIAVLDEAAAAGVLAARRTPHLIPLCHPLLVDDVTVTFELAPGTVTVTATAETVGPTGVEMEALTACAFAALTLAAGHRHATRKPVIGALALWEKSGGRSGDWRRGETVPPGSSSG